MQPRILPPIFRSMTHNAALAVLCLASLSSHAAELKMGIAVALTGGAAQYGVTIRNGFQLAADEINAKGGINGNTIKLIIEDEQGKKEEAINVFKKFIFQDKVLMILGPTLSNSMFAAGPIANSAKTVVLGTTLTVNGITDIGPYVFRNSLMESDVLPLTVSTAAKHYNLKNVAIIYGNDDALTKNAYGIFKDALDNQKIGITATETFVKGDVDFKAQLTKIKGTNPEAIVCSCFAEEAANIILQARGLGLKVPFIGGNAFNSPKLFEISKLAGEGTFVGSPWANTNPAPVNQNFIKSYKEKFNSEPTQYAAQSYDAIYIAAAALKNVKITGDINMDREALKEALPKTTIEGVTGAFKFRAAQNKTGKPSGFDADQKPFIYIVKGGKFTLYDAKSDKK